MDAGLSFIVNAWTPDQVDPATGGPPHRARFKPTPSTWLRWNHLNYTPLNDVPDAGVDLRVTAEVVGSGPHGTMRCRPSSRRTPIRPRFYPETGEATSTSRSPSERPTPARGELTRLAGRSAERPHSPYRRRPRLHRGVNDIPWTPEAGALARFGIAIKVAPRPTVSMVPSGKTARSASLPVSAIIRPAELKANPYGPANCASSGGPPSPR